MKKLIYYTLIAILSSFGSLWAQQWETATNANDITNTNSGNVGIGTNNLASKFAIHRNGSSSNYMRVTNSTTGEGSGNGTLFGIDTSHGTAIWNYENTEMYFGTNNQRRLTIDSTGDVGIGTTSPDEKLTVKGTIHTEEVRVDLNVPAPDYVFEESYDLRTLAATEAYIKTNKHLPEIPSAKQMEANGVELGDMNMLLLKKIEELTLYTIEQEKKIQKLEKENETLKSLSERLAAIEKQLKSNN